MIRDFNCPHRHFTLALQCMKGGGIKSIFFLFIALTAFIPTSAQVNSDAYRLNVYKSRDLIKVDGKLNETTWAKAEFTGQFTQNFPIDSIPATSQTKVALSFDENNLYIAGVCSENPGEEHIIQSLRRDYEFSLNENLMIYVDPFDDYTNGFAFGITPAGVEREGLVTNGQDVSTDWDNKWTSAVQNYHDRWEFEMSIPFKTLRYNASNREWNILLLRMDLKNNQRSTWPPVPLGFQPSSFAFSGKVIFRDPLKKSGANISLIPYLTGSVAKDHEESTDSNAKGDIGFDAKIAVTPALNLDLTFNPDFSQVEVDRQVTNLSRFEIFFPERRQFFLENRDLFGQGGFMTIRPFFSRRIGIAEDTTDNTLQVPIQFGARLSGKLGKNWRIGVLNMQTQDEDPARLTGIEEIENSHKLLQQNYTVAVFQRQVFTRSNLGAIFVNRQALNFSAEDTTISTTQYNRVIGLDYNLLSKDNRWEGDIFYHRSLDPDKKDDAFASGAFLRYQVRTMNIGFFSSIVGEGYNAEVGFVPRKDIIRLGIFPEFFFYPKSKTIQRHGPGFDLSHFTDLEFNRTDQEFEGFYGFQFLNTSELVFGTTWRYQLLRDPFDPTNTDGEELAEGTDYSWQTIWFFYSTDTRKLLSLETEAEFGGFYNGDRYNIRGQVNYRFQPFGSVALNVDYNNIELPEPLNDASFWLISPRVDLTFTRKVFFTTFLQFNDQDDNVNLNARFQYRFKPVSDLFVVYTENYFPDNFAVKNRAIVLKLTYWLNI